MGPDCKLRKSRGPTPAAETQVLSSAGNNGRTRRKPSELGFARRGRALFAEGSPLAVGAGQPARRLFFLPAQPLACCSLSVCLKTGTRVTIQVRVFEMNAIGRCVRNNLAQPRRALLRAPSNPASADRTVTERRAATNLAAPEPRVGNEFALLPTPRRARPSRHRPRPLHLEGKLAAFARPRAGGPGPWSVVARC